MTANPFASGNPFSTLTRRERQVLIRLTACRTNRQIGADLGIDRQTVKVHLTAIYRKLGVSDRTGAVVCALTGLAPPYSVEVHYAPNPAEP